MAEVPFCKDCEHFRRSMVGKEYAKCHRPVFTEERVDLVYGVTPPRAKPSNSYCDLDREHVCGREARYFRPKSDWRPWLRWVL